MSRATAASRPCGARISARSEMSRFTRLPPPATSAARRPARHAAKNALETHQRLAQRNPAAVDAIFADRVFVRAGALLDHRYRPPNPPERLEIAQQDHGVGKVGDVDRRFHVADQAVLRDGEEGRCALPVQILQQLVHVQDQRLFLRHRRLVAVEAVDHDGCARMLLNAAPDPLRKFAWRQLGGIDLLDRSACRCRPSPGDRCRGPWRARTAGPALRRRRTSPPFRRG